MDFGSKVTAEHTPMATKPCPFCGATNIDVCEGTTFRWRQAMCRECGGRAGEVRIQTFGDGKQEEWEEVAAREAIEAWNQRAEVKAV